MPSVSYQIARKGQSLGVTVSLLLGGSGFLAHYSRSDPEARGKRRGFRGHLEYKGSGPRALANAGGAAGTLCRWKGQQVP